MDDETNLIHFPAKFRKSVDPELLKAWRAEFEESARQRVLARHPIGPTPRARLRRLITRVFAR